MKGTLLTEALFKMFPDKAFSLCSLCSSSTRSPWSVPAMDPKLLLEADRRIPRCDAWYGALLLRLLLALLLRLLLTRLSAAKKGRKKGISQSVNESKWKKWMSEWICEQMNEWTNGWKIACVAGVERERGSGNLGARARTREKGKEPPPLRAVSRPQFPSPSLSNACHAG